MTTRDERSPAQVAEEAAREAHGTCPYKRYGLCVGESHHMALSESMPCDWPSHRAIDRALAAARWAQHVEDCSMCDGRTPLCTMGTGLRRAYESLNG